MDRLREEIRLLRTRLEAMKPLPGSTEHTVIGLLHNLSVAAERTPDARLLTPHILELEHFWLHSVAWCSSLSKDIEKILIVQEEESEGA